jgi:Protein of unknown function (DUF3054)
MVTVTAPAAASARIGRAGALVADVLLVALFTAIGRASHDEGVLTGLVRTAWPFLVGLGVGWLLVAVLHLPGTGIRTGTLVWGTTLVGGMVLRVLTGQGTAPSFIVVAGVVLGVFLVGWRALAAAIGSRSR